MPPQKIDIVVIVNGQEARLSGNPQAALHSILEKALRDTGNIGQGPENWEFRDAEGTLLDLGAKLGSFGEGARLFLNLKAGIGGSGVTAAPQAVDPAVSRSKFDREIAEFRAQSAHYGRRGWFLVDAQFPTAFVVLGIPQIKPAGMLCGVLFDYTDYDVRPPSIRFVEPFTREPYPPSELPTRMLRETEIEPPPGFPMPPGAMVGRMVQQQPLIMDYAAAGSDDPPFLCLAGVREYHDHPAHSGDRWELHRAAGAGRLVRLLEVIDTYAVRPINGYGVNLVPQVGGFTQNEVPS